MSIEVSFGNFFKPEIQSSGRKLVAESKISMSAHSETEILAYVRVSPPFRVKLSAESATSPTFSADCSCPVAQKSRFCKHVWATLVAVESEYPDFLSGKTELLKPEVASLFEGAQLAQDKPSPHETAKKRASDYRKAQYQKLKARTKEKERERVQFDAAISSSAFTTEVEASLHYFSENGFPMPAGPSREILAEAKKKLSRVFHPDKGGSHDESVELNRHCEILLEFFRA